MAAMAAVTVGYVGLAHASQLWQVALLYGLLFGTGVLTASLAANALVANWFVRRRGLAMGIATAGIAAGGVILPPTGTLLLERFGFVDTCLMLAGVALCLIPLIGWLVIDYPEMKGMRMEDTALGSTAVATQEVSEEWTLATLLKSSRFWCVALIAAVLSGLTNALYANLMPLAQQAGIPRQAASYLVSTINLSGIVGTLVLGKLFDSLSQRTIVRLLGVVLIVPCLLFMGRPSYGLLLLAVATTGAAGGAILLLPAVMAGSNFGRGSFALAYGVISTVLVVFITSMISLFAYAYDVFGTYDVALKGFVALLVVVFFSANLLSSRSDGTTAVPAGEK